MLSSCLLYVEVTYQIKSKLLNDRDNIFCWFHNTQQYFFLIFSISGEMYTWALQLNHFWLLLPNSSLALLQNSCLIIVKCINACGCICFYTYTYTYNLLGPFSFVHTCKVNYLGRTMSLEASDSPSFSSHWPPVALYLGIGPCEISHLYWHVNCCHYAYLVQTIILLSIHGTIFSIMSTYMLWYFVCAITKNVCLKIRVWS